MSLEQALKENTEALRAMTAALAGAGKAGAGKASNDEAADKPTRTRRTRSTKTEDTNESKYTVEQVKAVAVKVKDELGTAEAKKLIKKYGKAAQLADIEAENYEAFVIACEKALDDSGDDDGDDDDDDI